MILKNWKRINKYYNFEESVNRVTRSFIDKDENIKINGFLSFERSLIGYKKMFCIYSIDNELFFFAEGNKWNINDNYSSTFIQSTFCSSFTLFYKNSKIYQFKYLSIFRKFFIMIDPTYDFIDFESDNFLFYFSNLIESIKNDKKYLNKFVKNLS